MKIAELFVNLGITGGDKSAKTLKDTKSGLGEVKSMSLEAKASILAVVYGMTQLMTGSARAGKELFNFGTLTGLSTEKLQQWQYAGRKAGTTSEEITSSIMGVQKAMTDLALNGNAPAHFGIIASMPGFDRNRIRDTFYVMEKMQELAKKVKPEIFSQIASEMGIGADVAANMIQQRFNEKAFKGAPIRGVGMQKQLDGVYGELENFKDKAGRMFDGLTAKHGSKLIKDLTLLTGELTKFIDASITLGDKLFIFEGLQKAVEATAAAMKLMTVGVDDLTGQHKQGDNEKMFGKDSWITKALNWRDEQDKKFLGSVLPAVQYMRDGIDTKAQAAHKTEVKQTNIFHGTMPQDHAKEVKKATTDALRQSSAQVRGN